MKAAREKQQITYKGMPISLTADLSAVTLQARREGQDIFKVMKVDWLNGYKNKTRIYAVYNRPTSDLGTHTD